MYCGHLDKAVTCQIWPLGVYLKIFQIITSLYIKLYYYLQIQRGRWDHVFIIYVIH